MAGPPAFIPFEERTRHGVLYSGAACIIINATALTLQTRSFHEPSCASIGAHCMISFGLTCNSERRAVNSLQKPEHSHLRRHSPAMISVNFEWSSICEVHF